MFVYRVNRFLFFIIDCLTIEQIYSLISSFHPISLVVSSQTFLYLCVSSFLFLWSSQMFPSTSVNFVPRKTKHISFSSLLFSFWRTNYDLAKVFIKWIFLMTFDKKTEQRGSGWKTNGKILTASIKKVGLRTNTHQRQMVRSTAFDNASLLAIMAFNWNYNESNLPWDGWGLISSSRQHSFALS